MAKNKLKHRKMKLDNTIANLSNRLLETFVKHNDLLAFKTLLYIAKSQFKTKGDYVKKLDDNQNYKISINIKEAIHFLQCDVKTIKRSLDRLSKTTINYRGINEDGHDVESWIAILPKGEINYTTETYDVWLFGEVLKLIHQTTARVTGYTPVKTQNFISLKSKHSVRMLLLIERISNYDKKDANGINVIGKRQKYTLDKLNNLFGTKYTSYSLFMKKVLEPAKHELDKNSKLSFEFFARKERIGEVARSRGRTPITAIIIDVITNNILKEDK